jgi:hypothetical protein
MGTAHARGRLLRAIIRHRPTRPGRLPRFSVEYRRDQCPGAEAAASLRIAAAAPRAPVAADPLKYGRELESGKTYRAKARCDGTYGLLLVPAVKMTYHHGVRVSWLNLEAFPELSQRPACERRIVFKVMKTAVTPIDQGRRWNTEYFCRILRVERE